MRGLVQKFVYLLSAVAVIIVWAGCAAAVPSKQEGNVSGGSDYPAPGGTYYQSGRPEVTVFRLMEMLEYVDQRILRPEKEFRQEHVVTACIRLAVLLAGVGRIQTYEASSVSAGAGNWFRNTRLWRSKEAVPLFQLFAEDGTLEAASLGELPRNTVFALRMQWDPAVVFQALKFAPSHGKALEGFLRGMTGMEPEIFARSVRGCWEFVCVAEEPGGDTVFRITVPDEEGKCYNFLTTLLDAAEGGEPLPMVERNGKRTSYCSDRSKKSLFEASKGRTLADTPAFRAALKALPQRCGSILCWADGVPVCFPGERPIRDDGFESVCFLGLTMFRRVPDGLIAWSASPQDLNSETLQMLTPLLVPLLSGDREREPASEAAPVPEETEKSASVSVSAGGFSGNVAARLKNAHRILRQEAAENGVFPDEKRAAELLGEQMLSHFCYVSGWNIGDNAKLPLLIQRPDDGQGDAFLVLTVDGTCRLIQLEDYRSLKRAAGELHSRYSYAEQEFFRLIRKAADADRTQNAAPQRVQK